MTAPCAKCGNTVLPKRTEISPGLTTQPCPLCGDQNYSFPDQMRQTKDGAEIYDLVCVRCKDVFYINYRGKRDYCDDCLFAVRSAMATLRNKARRESGKFVGITFGM